MNKEYVGFVKCTTCSKVMKHDIHSSGTIHLLLDYGSLERARFSPNKHSLCSGGGNRHITHSPHLQMRTVRGSVSIIQLLTRTVRGPYAADADYPRM